MKSIPCYWVSYRTTQSEFWVLSSCHGSMARALKVADDWAKKHSDFVRGIRILELVATNDRPTIEVVWTWPA